MYCLTLLSVLFPAAAGSTLLVWRPENRRLRNVYCICAVLISSVFVLGSVAATAVHGAGSTALTLVHMNDMLSLALRIDGASMVFGCIIGVLWPVTTVYAFSYMEHEGMENKFFGFFLLSYGVVAGVAFSANFFTMYLFYEFMTLATLPLVMHEMDAKAKYAGKKYILYSMTGAALAFIVLVLLLSCGSTLDFTYGGVLDAEKSAGMEETLRLVFVLGFFGFGVKSAIFPFHGWLPAASVAPTPVTALLHAVAVVKSGAFAVMRLIYFSFGTGLLFGSWAQNLAMCAAALTIAYASVMALRMPHLKRRLAYSTISNLSYILLAFAVMTPAGLTGGLLHIIYHAVVKITLFFCAGAILHRTGLEYVAEMEGLHRRMPVTCAVFTFAVLALMGVPPLGGFIGKWSIASAACASGSWAGYVGAAALIVSTVLTTLYMMTAVIRFYFPLRDAAPVTERSEADWQMLLPLGILVALIAGLSLASGTLIDLLSGIGGAV